MNRSIRMGIIILLSIFILFSGCLQPGSDNQNTLPDITGKNILCIIAPHNYSYQELQETTTVLKSSNGTVFVASISTEPARSSTGECITPEFSIQDICLDEYDAVVFIGGPGVNDYISNTTFLGTAQKASAENKIIAAICIAPCILANAGLLVGKNATVFPGYESYLQTNGAHVIDQSVVQDGAIITANGPSAAEAFAEQIVRSLVTETE